MSPSTQFLVGTASWTDPTLVKSDVFYPADVKTAEERLTFYAAQFPTVEVDSSYYALLSEKVAQLWSERTPAGFIFNIKAFAWLTQHPADTNRLPAVIKESLPENLRNERRIKRPPAELLDLAFRMFWSSLEPLRNAGKLGMILFQFPPYVTWQKANFDYIGALRERMPSASIAVEFRHPSWTDDEGRRAATIGFLREHGLTFTSVDTPPQSKLPALLEVTTSDAYVRFHGRNDANWFKREITAAERFKYLYAERELAEWAGKLKKITGARRAFVIFNNCYRNFGVMNATTMAQMLAREEP